MEKGIFSSLFFGNALIKMTFKIVLAFDVFALAQRDITPCIVNVC